MALSIDIDRNVFGHSQLGNYLDVDWSAVRADFPSGGAGSTNIGWELKVTMPGGVVRTVSASTVYAPPGITRGFSDPRTGNFLARFNTDDNNAAFVIVPGTYFYTLSAYFTHKPTTLATDTFSASVSGKYRIHIGGIRILYAARGGTRLDSRTPRAGSKPILTV